MKSPDIARIAFHVTAIVSAVLLTFLAGMYSAINRNFAYRAVDRIHNSVKAAFSAISETSVLVPEHFIQPARSDGAGVTVNLSPDDGSLVMLSGFFEGGNEIRLIRRDGSVVQRWPVAFSRVFTDPRHMASPPATDWNIDLHGALLMPDGSPVFNFEYGGLVKLDRCGDVVWSLAHPTHHSVEPAEKGGFWVPGQRQVDGGQSEFPPFPVPYDEDLILKISESGSIEREISVARLLYDSGLSHLLTATGESFKADMSWDGELLHLNKITELRTDMAGKFSMLQAGDLLLSLREQNLLLVVDPASGRVKWWQTGPWIRQHDPEFDKDGTMSVFNNNAYRSALGPYDRSDPSIPRVSNILRVDPATHATRIVYGGSEGQELLSVIRGKFELTEAGGFLITEFEAGRVLETDADGRIVWEYINRYDGDHVAEITEARMYGAHYFTNTDWNCAP